MRSMISRRNLPEAEAARVAEIRSHLSEAFRHYGLNGTPRNLEKVNFHLSKAAYKTYTLTSSSFIAPENADEFNGTIKLARRMMALSTQIERRAAQDANAGI